MILFSDRGTPYGYRHMNGYSSHTFKWVNAKGEAHLVKYHFKTAQGIKNFTNSEAAEMGKVEKDFAQPGHEGAACPPRVCRSTEGFP